MTAQRRGVLAPPSSAIPVVELEGFDTGPCRLFLKLESQNPGGSIKDRIGLSMIAAAERDGRLGPHQPQLVEAPGAVPRNAGIVTKMIGALDLTGVRAMMTV